MYLKEKTIVTKNLTAKDFNNDIKLKSAELPIYDNESVVNFQNKFNSEDKRARSTKTKYPNLYEISQQFIT